MSSASDRVPPHVVMLVHGIRTRGEPFEEIRNALIESGFQPELTNYGRFDLVRFLLPIPFFKAWAAAHIERDIRSAMKIHRVEHISVIAHSFGTYIIAWILKKRFDINFGRIIFCGSVVRARFPFEELRERYLGPILNEVGTKDIWPILAESVTWGYGSTGAFGVHRPGVFDRYHRGMTHSAFLNAKFCIRYWVPFLRGQEPIRADLPEQPPFYLRLLSAIHLKYILLVLLALLFLFLWCRAPSDAVRIEENDVYFVGEELSRLVVQAQQVRPGFCPNFMQCSREMVTTGISSAAEKLVLCHSHKLVFSYRDPTVALERLKAETVPCLVLQGIEDGYLKVDIDRALAHEVRTEQGKSLWLCGCDAAAQQRVLELVGSRR